jgi:hypothetical protein
LREVGSGSILRRQKAACTKAEWPAPRNDSQLQRTFPTGTTDMTVLRKDVSADLAPPAPGAARLGDTAIEPSALDFCRARGLMAQLNTAIVLAQSHFSITGQPTVRLLHDPEVDSTAYLLIELQTVGTVKENVTSHKRFSIDAASLLGPSRELIRLTYDIN